VKFDKQQEPEMTYLLQKLLCAIRSTSGISLNAVSSTHGQPGFQMPDSRVISRVGFIIL